MELTLPVRQFHFRKTHRLIPSRFPPVGILDRVSDPDDLDAIFELEGWTNDRITNELGILELLPRSEWVSGTPNASIVMAAFCHPRPEGSRFNDGSLGAWYAALTLRTAHAEVLHHRQRELAEVGVTNTSLLMREYRARFQADFHSLLEEEGKFDRFYDPESYAASRDLGSRLRGAGSNGIVYRSVRDSGGTCVVCFRPGLIRDVRQGSHFEYHFSRSGPPLIRRIRAIAAD